MFGGGCNLLGNPSAAGVNLAARVTPPVGAGTSARVALAIDIVPATGTPNVVGIALAEDAGLPMGIAFADGGASPCRTAGAPGCRAMTSAADSGSGCAPLSCPDLTSFADARPSRPASDLSPRLLAECGAASGIDGSLLS